MLRRLYNWVLELARSKYALPAMGAVSFAESSFFPIPPDIMLLPMVLAQPRKAFRIALVCTVCSVLGGLLGYAIGFYFFETLGAWVVKTYHLEAGLAEFRAGFAANGVWIILGKGLTPIPYKLITISAGAAHFDLFTFVWASILTRGVRFFVLATLLWKYGDTIRPFIEKWLPLLLWLFLIALIGGFVAFRYLF
jgi:membrane protein YqaA with SNARE-associated domain